MRFLPLLAILALATPSAALAQDEAPPVETVKPEKPVCKTTSTTGSRLRKTRYCMTKWEAKLDEEKARRDADQMRRLNTAPPPGTPF
ncbi:hypothetical protein Q9Q95_18335 [Sphingomonas sp. DG1-23]|uniref:hypothetical protein n=1 Tax=Sphingomonas sp. DG1-23 TaxID=3068316 RepID=UPI00273E311D|nr:hypothetical protein [Sphingomonas sp. DG1-23]MDP5280889.1 hypothetical protein [Sphingomonas sp. DG1-23]